MDPINYILDVKNPIEEAIKGYTMGRNDIAQRQEMQIQQQNATMAQKAFEDQQTALAEQRAAAAQQQAQAAAYQQDLMVAKDEVEKKTWTAEDAAAFKLKYATNFDEVTAVVAAMDEPKLAATRNYNISVVVPLFMGDTETALKNVDERIAAAEASGNVAEAQAQRAFRQTIVANPYAAGLGLTLTSNASGLFSDELMKNILDKTQTGQKPTDAMRTQDAQLRAAGIVPKTEGGDGRYESAMAEAGGVTPDKPAEAASPLGKVFQDVENGILPQSVADSALKVEALNAAGGLTLKDKVNEEARLRGEYNKRTENLTAANRNYSIIETSAASGTGAGDIALITSFMKMLDPGSVVRETEFAIAENAGGLLSYLKTLPEKIESGQLLTPQQRNEFQTLARQYLEAAQAQEPVVRQSYQAIVDNYGLNPVNVFGARAATESAAGAIPQSFLSSQAVIKAATKNGTTPEAMWGIMSAEQRALYGE